ncbi:MAG: hypothetical protein FD180_4608 [Planctomycetota bacterium]|nr:MAG: hypothetical protein FD180_4608 [Planctomycetota bacterium]
MKPLAALLLFASAALAGDCKRDCTGIEWTLPFKAALEKAKKEKRLLLIKPIAFGTEKNGGW